MIEQPVLWFFCGMGGMLALIALHVPIGAAMAITGTVGTTLMLGQRPAFSILSTEIVTAISSVDLATIPLFLLMGGLASAGGLTSDLYNAAARFLGHRRGGLTMATVAGAAGFGAISGSSVATTAAMARIALPEMERRGYAPGISAGSIAAGGSLAILIPPSIILVLYAVLTEQFVIDLFIAGIIPGLVSVALYFCAILIYGHLYPDTMPRGPVATWTARARSVAAAWRALAIVVVVTFGIYAGVVTVVEAASLGVFLTFVFWLLSPGASWPALQRILIDTAGITGMIFLMVIGANVLGYFITLTNAPSIIVESIGNSSLPPFGVILLILVIYLFLGMIFDAVAGVVLTLPFVFPLVVSLGYDPIWWGIVNVMIIEIAAITPPIGINVFVLHASAPHIRLGTIFRGILPFLTADIVRLGLLLAFPALATFLPQYLK